MNPESLPGNDLGFDPAAIYRTYDEYINDEDRSLLEYFMQDVYATYGYDFHYYHEEKMNMDLVKQKLQGLHHLDQLIHETVSTAIRKKAEKANITFQFNGSTWNGAEGSEHVADKRLENCAQNRIRITGMLLWKPNFVNPDGQPLRLMKKLELIPALLEQPLYH